MDQGSYVNYVLQVENAISPEMCEEIIGHSKNRTSRQATFAGGKENLDVRNTLIVDTKGIEGQLNQMMADLVINRIEPFYRMKVECIERPVLLMYHPGGKYEAHLDGEQNTRQPDGSYVWKRLLARDISIILYLNDKFTGGQLSFPKINFKIQPKAGLLVAFPSGRPYLHKAETVESGERLAIVTWATCLSRGPMRQDAPASTVYMKNYRKITG